MGAVDRDLRLEQGIGQAEQQRRPIAGIDLDHGEAVRRLVVDQHIGLDAEGFGAGAGQRARFQLGDHAVAVGQGILDRCLDPRQLLGTVEGTAQRILHQEIVDRDAIARRMDARVDDVAASQMDGAGDAVEQARMVGCIDGDQSRAALGIILRGDRQRGVTRFQYMPRIMDQDIVRFGDPVAFGHAAAEGGEGRLIHAQRLAQRLLLGGNPLAAALLLVAQAQHFLGRVIEVAQQLPLPAVPDARPHRTDIDHGQAQQQAQPLGALHHFDEIEDRLVVGQVALEGGG